MNFVKSFDNRIYPRYSTDVDSKVSLNGRESNSRLIDVSNSGVGFECASDFKSGQVVLLNFVWGVKMTVTLVIEIVHSFSRAGDQCFGAKIRSASADYDEFIEQIQL